MSKNTHIAFVMPWHISERGGGAEVQANYLSEELASRGFQVTYICQTIHNIKINTIETIGKVRVHWLKPSGKFHWVDQNKYYSKLKSIRPNIVIQRLSSNVSYSIGNYCSKYNAKFVWVCTDNMSPYRDYHVRKLKKNNTVKKVGFVKFHLFLKNAQIMDWYRNHGMKHVNISFTQNDNQYNILEEAFIIKSKRMVSGHPLPNVTKSPETKYNEKNILWCANFGQNKRPELFVELSIKLQKEGYNFIMVGSHSDKGYVETILNNKPDNLLVTGQLSFEESLSYFSKAALLVNTSVSEGFSNTYIQAWLRGVPTLVYGADPDNVIKNNQLGYVAKNSNDAVEFIKNVLSDFGMYEKLSINAENFAKENHTIEVMTNHFLCELNVESL